MSSLRGQHGDGGGRRRRPTERTVLLASTALGARGAGTLAAVGVDADALAARGGWCAAHSTAPHRRTNNRVKRRSAAAAAAATVFWTPARPAPALIEISPTLHAASSLSLFLSRARDRTGGLLFRHLFQQFIMERERGEEVTRLQNPLLRPLTDGRTTASATLFAQQVRRFNTL